MLSLFNSVGHYNSLHDAGLEIIFGLMPDMSSAQVKFCSDNDNNKITITELALALSTVEYSYTGNNEGTKCPATQRFSWAQPFLTLQCPLSSPYFKP